MDKYFLDTGIFMYAAGKEHEHKQPCIIILQKVKEKTFTSIIDTEVIQEILYRYHRIGMRESVLELSWSILDLVTIVLPVSQEDVKLALFYYKKYQKFDISPRDFIHLAIMINNGLTDIVSTDHHFDKFEEVTRVDPREL